MSRGPGHVMRSVAAIVAEVEPSDPATYRALARQVYGSRRVTEAQIKAVGRACRRLAELGGLEEWLTLEETWRGRPRWDPEVEEFEQPAPSWAHVAAVSRPLTELEWARARRAFERGIGGSEEYVAARDELEDVQSELSTVVAERESLPIGGPTEEFKLARRRRDRLERRRRELEGRQRALGERINELLDDAPWLFDEMGWPLPRHAVPFYSRLLRLR